MPARRERRCRRQRPGGRRARERPRRPLRHRARRRCEARPEADSASICERTSSVTRVGARPGEEGDVRRSPPDEPFEIAVGAQPPATRSTPTLARSVRRGTGTIPARRVSRTSGRGRGRSPHADRRRCGRSSAVRASPSLRTRTWSDSTHHERRPADEAPSPPHRRPVLRATTPYRPRPRASPTYR